jgi:hypothetical protein
MSEREQRAGFSVDVGWDEDRSRATATLRRDGQTPQLYEGDDPRPARPAKSHYVRSRRATVPRSRRRQGALAT